MSDASAPSSKAAPAASAPKGGKKGKAGGAVEARKITINDFPLPSYVQERLAVWERAKARNEQIQHEEKPIKISLPDGAQKDGIAWKTTPLDIASEISKGLAQNAVVAKVNGAAWDLMRPLESDSELQLFTFDSDEGRHAFWHSSAHVLGQALERRYGGFLCVGPPVEKPGGFYYDMAIPEQAITEEHIPEIEQLVGFITKDKQPFERLELTKEEALEMFRYNKYKSEIIGSKVPDGATCTAYRCGPLIDLCRGPHLPNTSRVKAFKVTTNSSSYWLGKAENDPLQRLYGVSFPDNKQLKQHLEHLEEMKLRDHRRIGKIQELFFFDPSSPGCAYWLPHGTRIYAKLQDLTRKEYRERGFTEVVTPNVFSKKLFETSGHWQNYKDNMFCFTAENQEFALKPMNCPSHCVMFKHRVRSYRELPIRFADFGVLHRNELSGTLTGLTRVRRFQQDDAHIFAMSSQIEAEIGNAILFMKHIYGIFNFNFDLELSTRPEKYLGVVEDWDRAEKQLEKALNESGYPWKLNPGDGAFYGPKIDIHITDAIGRSHQCATIQLDFQLPRNFELEYMTESGEIDRPVIIHRAIYGSLERFTAILTEHLNGKWPLWLSPRQLLVVSIDSKQHEYCQNLQKQLHDEGFYVDIDLTDATLPKKMKRLRENPLYNFILVVGGKEAAAGEVNIRDRESNVLGTKKIEELIADLKQRVANFE